MEQYIPKSALVAEIERRLWLLVPKMTFHQQRVELEKLLSFIETLEVKEVNLEKEMDKYFDEHDEEFCREEYLDYAKYFFELGMSVSNKEEKGEEV